MVLRFVLIFLFFDHIVWWFIFVYAVLKHSYEPQHHFHRDWHCHGGVYYVVLRKYGFKVCVISFHLYSTCYKVYIHISCINTQRLTTTPFRSTHVISSRNCQTMILYQGSSNRCGGDRNLNIILLIQIS